MELRKRIEEGKYDVPSGVFDSEGRAEYRRQGGELKMQFKADLLEYLSITGHPKSEELWNQAWEGGHSSGYENVLCEAEILVELMDVGEWSPIWPTKAGGYWFHGKRFSGEDVEVRFARCLGEVANTRGGKTWIYSCEGIALYVQDSAEGVWMAANIPAPPKEAP